MAAIRDYGELIAEVQTRVEDSGVSMRAALFTQLAENMLAKRLLVSDQEKYESLTPVTPTEGFGSDAGFGVVALPDDFQEMNLVRTGSEFLPLIPFADLFLSDAKGYAVRGPNLLSTEIDAAHDCYYFGPIEPSLVGAGTSTNWLLELEPEIYLYALLFQVYQSSGDAENLARVSSYLGGLINSAKVADSRRRYNKTRIRVPSAP